MGRRREHLRLGWNIYQRHFNLAFRNGTLMKLLLRFRSGLNLLLIFIIFGVTL